MEISGLRRRKKRNSEGNEKRTRFLEEESSYGESRAFHVSQVLGNLTRCNV